jgi:hypothetical protein
VTELGEQ